MTAEFHSFLRSRRSVRRFRPQAVPQTVLQKILETATYAPSAHNKQPWRFAVVTTAGSKERLAAEVTARFRLDMTQAGIEGEQIQARVEKTVRRTNEAPAIVILCWDHTRIDLQPNAALQQIETMMGVQSVATAGLQLLLAAHAEGLGATWICWPLFAPEAICQALDLPKEWEPQGMVFLGYPAEHPDVPERQPLDEIAVYL